MTTKDHAAALVAAYRLGRWRCVAPAVCTDRWSEADWIRYIGDADLMRSAPELFAMPGA